MVRPDWATRDVVSNRIYAYNYVYMILFLFFFH